MLDKLVVKQDLCEHGVFRSSCDVCNGEKEVTEKQQDAPEGWSTVRGISSTIGGGKRKPINTLANRYEKKYPGNIVSFYNPKARRELLHFSPELSEYIVNEIQNREPVPDGWENKHEIARRIGETHESIDGAVKKLSKTIEIEDHKEKYIARERGERHIYHFSPQLIEMIEDSLLKKAGSKHLNAHNIYETLNKAGFSCTQPAISNILKDFPGTLMRDSMGRKTIYYEKSTVKEIEKLLSKREIAPSGWKTKRHLSTKLDISEIIIDKAMDGAIAKSTGDLKYLHGERGAQYWYYSPKAIKKIEEFADKYHKENGYIKENRLKKDLNNYLEDVLDSDSIKSSEFRELINLFGSSSSVDVLYKHHSEFKGLKVSYVKKIMADYLGDFLVEKNYFNLEDIEHRLEYLSEPNLKESLTDVVKEDCLSYYNIKRKEMVSENADKDLDANFVINFAKKTFSEYIENSRDKLKDISNDSLEEIMNSVEEYYLSLFDDLVKPDNLVSELKQNRIFPDVNQLINIKEIKDKKRMLIADEMGLGKSGSVILAKEYLGLKTAIVVAPSNVISTWEGYLSDEINNDTGKQEGYFKKGLAPKILTINSVDDLEKTNNNVYDYILISQERLNDRYVEILENMGNDMLIVDEVHKLKNVEKGVRSTNILRLASKIEGEDEYLATLSGTPVPNKIKDVALVLRMMYPEKFGSLEKAEETYGIKIHVEDSSAEVDKEKILNQWLISNIINGDLIDLRTLLKPRMQKKGISESIEMPELVHEILYHELSQEEKDVYEVLMEQDELTASRKIQTLRHFLLNPKIIDVTPGIKSTKIEELNENIKEMFKEKNKVVVFVNGYIEGVIRGENTIIEQLDVPEDVTIYVIDGKKTKGTRDSIQNEFNRSSSRILLFVSGQTADVGIDLSGGEEVFFYNEPWTKYDQEQQLARVFREGLEGDITSKTSITENSIEEGIHIYIELKQKAVEKLVSGVPLTDIEKKLISEDEKNVDQNLEVNKELAEYYFSSWDKMMKIFGHTKEIGEQNFSKFLKDYGEEYAECYEDLSSRSYQANASRISGTILKELLDDNKQESLKIVDIASGPEMLKNHIDDELSDNVSSVDINSYHFTSAEGKKAVGSFVKLPFKDKAFDASNLSFALHYTKIPTKKQTERLEVLTEINRVLKKGGHAVINFIYSLDFKDEDKFKEILQLLGFKILDDYTGKVESKDNYKSNIITLEKNKDSLDINEIVKNFTKEDYDGLKFRKNKVSLKDSRKVVNKVTVNGKKLKLNFNTEDEKVYREEKRILKEAEEMKLKYNSIEDIPKEEIIKKKFVRFYNGKRYILFKKLESGSGAVVVKK